MSEEEEGLLDAKVRILDECRCLDGVMSEDTHNFEIEWLKYLQNKMLPIHGMKLRLTRIRNSKSILLRCLPRENWTNIAG